MEVFSLKEARTLRVWMGSYAVEMKRHWLKGRSQPCVPDCPSCKKHLHASFAWYIPVHVLVGSSPSWCPKILCTSHDGWWRGLAGAIVELTQKNLLSFPTTRVLGVFESFVNPNLDGVLDTLRRVFNRSIFPFNLVTMNNVEAIENSLAQKSGPDEADREALAHFREQLRAGKKGYSLEPRKGA